MAAPAGNTSKNWMGITALILGIVGIPMACCCGLGILLGGGGIALGILGKKAAAAGEASNSGMAKVGFILGIVAVAVSLLYFVLAIFTNAVNFGSTSFNGFSN
jgi:hypothetical protein